MEAIISFENVTQAIQAEQALLEAGFPVTVMPLPSSIRKGCGLCLRLPPERLEKAVSHLAQSGVSRSALFMRKDDGKIDPIEEKEL
jgi:hypothetical protein